ENGADEAPTADLPGDGDPCVKAGDPAAGNGLDDDQNGQADAGVYHGTFVAGIAAAVTNNGEGVAGMCWRCKILPVRVANAEGWVRSSDTADGITYAARNGARVINVSLGGSELSQAEQAAVDAAINTFKVVVVAAAGNENHNPISYPAQLSNVIAVGASARTNTKGRASFSNWGTGSPGNRVVDIVAPGESLASTAVYSVTDQNSGQGAAGTGTYLAGSGTSFSSPLVAGLVGLMLSRNPSLTPAQVQTILKQTATPLGDDPGDSPDAGPNWAGPGLVNALAAINAVPAATPTPAPSPSVSPTAITTPTQQPAVTATPSAVASTTPTATPAACPAASPVSSPTAAPSGTPAATPTPLPAGATPQTRLPACGVEITGLGTALSWNAAAGMTQFQVQVIPANNDGPAINLIRNAATSYVIDPPVFGTGPYVMLPQITYSWRIRTTTATTGIDETSPLWGSWSPMSTFKTRKASSDTITLTAPAEATTVAGLTPVLQWANTDNGIFYYEVQLSKDNNFGEKGPV
ncbi:MAG: S8 family serine peptidase, partial [Chloroflexota bacterium]